MGQDNRNQYIDVVRGIGIFLVVLGHAMVPRSPLLYAFHMPLFFTLSGILHQQRPDNAFLKAKVKHLLWPFALAFLGSWVLQLSVHLILGLGEPQITDPVYILRAFVLGDSDSVNNSPLWFLTGLFSMTVIYHFLDKWLKSTVRHLVVVMLTLFGVYFAAAHVVLPLKLQVALSCLLFFHLGNTFRESFLNYELRRKHMLLIPALIFIYVVANYFNLELTGIKKVNVYANTLGSAPLFYLSGITGTLWFLWVCKVFRPIRALTFPGEYSLYILILHYPLVNICRVLLQDYWDITSYSYSIAVSIFIMLVCLAVVWILRKWHIIK